MLEVIVLCEGQTEREFCRQVIAPQLAASGLALAGTLAGKPQRKQGGIRPWPVYRRELLRLAAERPERHLGLLVDYYAMPDSWPGRLASRALPPQERGVRVEDSLREDLGDVLRGRLHPCVQLHEFESLLFVDPEIAALSLAIGAGAISYEYLSGQMSTIKADCGGAVEQIDDSPETAPSKRLSKIIRGYDKVAWGVVAAADVSVPVLRAGCPWLDRWLTRITGLGCMTL
jgi:hypothetical protein